mgnify:CR=1 FL=1
MKPSASTVPDQPGGMTAVQSSASMMQGPAIFASGANHCARSVTRAIHAIDVSAEVRVDLENGTVAIDGAVEPTAAKAAIEAEGYTVTSIETDKEQMVPTQPDKDCCGGCHA